MMTANASIKANLFLHILVSSFRLRERNQTEPIDSINVLTINLDTEKDVSASFAIGRVGINLLRELKAYFHATAMYVPVY